jgi:hypothetical protein
MVSQERRAVAPIARLDGDGQQLQVGSVLRGQVLLVLEAPTGQGVLVLDILCVQNSTHFPLVNHHELILGALGNSSLNFSARRSQVLFPTGSFQDEQGIHVVMVSEAGKHFKVFSEQSK